MENNSQKAIGFLFILFLTMTYKEMVWDPYFLAPVNEAARQQEACPSSCPPCDTIPSTTPQTGTTAAPQVVKQTAPKRSGFPTDQQLSDSGLLVLENGSVKVRLTQLGGRIFEFSLSSYAEHLGPDSPRLNLVEHTEGSPLPLGVYSGKAEDTWVNYSVEENSAQRVVLAGVLEDGRTIRKTIALTDKSYLLDINVELSAPPADGARLELEWARLIPKDSPKFLDTQSTGGFVWFDGQRARRETYNSMSGAEQKFGKVRWVSTTDHYFATSLVSKEGDADARALHDGEMFKIRLAGTANSGQFLLLGGPKSYRILSDHGFALERNIDFGWTGFLSAPLLTLLHMFYGIFGNYGLAIVALTILVRMLLLPLNAASFKSMKAMQELQPEVTRIRETMKDKQQQQLALMALYKERGVNPLGGCLPILIQIPIFFGLYSALLMAIELRHARWALWIRDLSAPEALMVGGFGIPVLVILFIASMLYQQWATPSTMDETQKKIMLVMPVIFGFVFFIHMPAGLTLYWLTSNVISIAQMHQLRKEGKHSAFLVTSAVAGVTLLIAFLLTLIG
jgi:YidC/Oxa1 family membrane protein insertase